MVMNMLPLVYCVLCQHIFEIAANGSQMTYTRRRKTMD